MYLIIWSTHSLNLLCFCPLKICQKSIYKRIKITTHLNKINEYQQIKITIIYSKTVILNMNKLWLKFLVKFRMKVYFLLLLSVGGGGVKIKFNLSQTRV